MSLILDALRKMEQDRNSRRGAAQNIRPEVLRYRGGSKPRQTRPYLPVAIGAALLACCIGVGLYLKGNRDATVIPETVSSASREPAAPQLPATPVAPVTPAVSANPGAPEQPVVQALPPVAAPVAAPRTEPRAASAPAGSTGATSVRQPVAAALQPRPEPDRAIKAKSQRRELTAAPKAAATDIVITGIAWQDEHSLRRAVVNGTLVGEGAEVAGARVVEIREDRVWLSRDGQVLEALLSSGSSR